MSKTVAFLAIGAFVVLAVPVGCALNLAHQGTRIIERTFNADNVIYNYEWFHRQYGDIQAYQQRLSTSRDALERLETSLGPERSGWKFEDITAWNQQSSLVTALDAKLAEMIQTYNARADMSNRGIFIGTELPTHIN